MRTRPSGKTTLTGSILNGGLTSTSDKRKPRDSRIRHFTVFREHGGNYIDYNIKFCLISRGDIDEDVSRAQCYFAVF